MGVSERRSSGMGISDFIQNIGAVLFMICVIGALL